MSPWVIAAVAGVLFAFAQYAGRELRIASSAVIPALLRAASVALLVALLLDAPAGRRRELLPWVAVDASASWRRGGETAPWRQAWRDLRAANADSVFLFGDSLRVGHLPDSLTTPDDQASVVRPAVDRGLSRGHPVVVVTDGEVADPEALADLPAGSRVIVEAHAQARDLAVSSLEMPRAVVSGDTVEIRVGVVAGGRGAAPGTLTLAVGTTSVATASVDTLSAFAERTLTVRSRIDGSPGPAILRAIVRSPGDVEPRNDTLSIGIDISRAASAVFVSTSPDFDARYALSVLRGALAVPTRGYFRVAPGAWRIDGALGPVSEADVRAALRDAPVAILHGDTAVFGAPRRATAGPLALIVPAASEDGEWYAAGAPPSPLAAALSGLPWDSLPPISVGAVTPPGEWKALEARRGREQDRRVIVAGSDSPRRIVIVSGSGLWRWRFRGGASSDAFTALWGSLFDWLAAERADRRAAVPTGAVVRAGEPVRWHRGSLADSVAFVVLRRYGVGSDSGRVDSLTLRFRGDATIAETPPLKPGLYYASTRGGSTMLAVNASREWLPRAPSVTAGNIGGGTATGSAPRLRSVGWVYALLLILLCGEWVVRRRRGMR